MKTIYLKVLRSTCLFDEDSKCLLAAQSLIVVHSIFVGKLVWI